VSKNLVQDNILKPNGINRERYDGNLELIKNYLNTVIEAVPYFGKILIGILNSSRARKAFYIAFFAFGLANLGGLVSLAAADSNDLHHSYIIPESAYKNSSNTESVYGNSSNTDPLKHTPHPFGLPLGTNAIQKLSSINGSSTAITDCENLVHLSGDVSEMSYKGDINISNKNLTELLEHNLTQEDKNINGGMFVLSNDPHAVFHRIDLTTLGGNATNVVVVYYGPGGNIIKYFEKVENLSFELSDNGVHVKKILNYGSDYHEKIKPFIEGMASQGSFLVDFNEEPSKIGKIMCINANEIIIFYGSPVSLQKDEPLRISQSSGYLYQGDWFLKTYLGGEYLSSLEAVGYKLDLDPSDTDLGKLMVHLPK
jgi:hypothetical protein